MDKDRTEIYNTISEMLDNPDKYGIFPTTECYDKLERYIEEVRIESLGWALAESCTTLDKGKDPRKSEIGEILERALVDLS